LPQPILQTNICVFNEKKAVLDAKTDASASTAELEDLQKELEVLEERI
jgi:predicted  nucleic acid-binding Zn-ribbon protein